MATQGSSVFELNVQGLKLRLGFSGPDHEDWLSAFVDVSAEPFSGTYAFQMLSSELKELLEKLQELERSVGKAFEISWENHEKNLQLKLSLSSRGQLVGNYRLAAGLGWQGANLSGQFHADQSYLGDWVQQLKQVQRELG